MRKRKARTRRYARATVALAVSSVVTLASCRSGGASGSTAEPRSASDGASCQANQTNLIRLLEALPEHGFAERGRPDLPTASLGGVVGDGLVLDVGETRAWLEGELLEGSNPSQRIMRLRRRLAELTPSTSSPSTPRASRLYVSTSHATEVSTLRAYLTAVPRHLAVHLMFQAPTSDDAQRSETHWSRWPAKLWSTRDPEQRRQLSQQAYAELTTCPSVLAAVEADASSSVHARWPALRLRLLEAIGQCDCERVQAPELRQLFMAEQRAGVAALGSVPVDFVRDERCGASLTYSTTQRLLADIEAFDADFAGRYGQNSLNFEKVVTNERLRVHLCNALPGETLAALQRAGRTLFWRVPGVDGCQAWQLDPLERGSPMGTWRQIVADADEGISIHYWQGAEEIRLYGPVPSALSKPTDEAVWECNQNIELRHVNAESIQLGQGRWFFQEEACRNAPPRQSELSGCVAALAGGTLSGASPEEPEARAKTSEE